MALPVQTRRWSSAICAVLALAAFVQPTRAQTPATQPVVEEDTRAQRLQSLLNDLAHSDADVRERARVELMAISRSELLVFRTVVQRSQPLLPAQALVLREIVMQAYLAADAYPADNDTGFLGVRLADADREDGEEGNAGGVLITGRIIGFGGYRMLRTGDIVVRVADQANVPLQNTMHFAALIRTFPAGATVHLDVLRQGQVVRVPVRLDARPLELQMNDDLDNFNWRRSERFHGYWKRTFAPLIAPPAA